MTYKEIQKIAKELRIEEEVIDKNWILEHFLNAMFSFSDISDNFVFKGGTCLKKNYFQDYRFSEDLDFTLLDETFVINELFFKRIIGLTEQNSGAKFYLKNIKPQIHKDIPQGYEVTVLFWGAFHKPNQVILPVNRWQTKIKLDISFSEKIIMKPELKNISHSYSDSEIISTTDYSDIVGILKQKSENKNIDCCKYDDFVNQKKYKSNKRAWESSLAYHLPQGQLADYDVAYNKVEQFVKQILK